MKKRRENIKEGRCMKGKYRMVSGKKTGKEYEKITQSKS